MTIQAQHFTSPLTRLSTVGKTRLLQIRSLSTPRVSIWAKAEWQQPGGSVKARAAHHIITKAIRTGALHAGNALLDASSGNTAIAYATLLQPLGWSPVICLPSNASAERKNILKSLGARLILTSPLEGTDGAQQVAREMFEAEPEKYFYADQYTNEANWQAHYDTTAPEIWQQTDGRITHFVAGLGTTGTFTGTGRRLKEWGSVHLTALQPDHPFHPMEGWKHLETARVPKIYDPLLADEILRIDGQAVTGMIKYMASQEQLQLSPSAAANLLGAVEVARHLDEGLIVTTLADTLDRYSEIQRELFNR